VVTTASGYILFGEVPGLRIVLGAAIVIAALQTVAWLDRAPGR
jgi:drug/metabolite transporter (DMT)-like permease